MHTLKIAFICASLRKDSINRKLENSIIRLFEEKGAKTQIINLDKLKQSLNIKYIMRDFDVKTAKTRPL